jgi:type II secretory pathway pseudopilin PulG
MGFKNRKLRDERGIAMALVLMVMVVVAALAAVAAAGAIRANHQSFRDRNSKRAFQAAVAGIQAANDVTTLLQPDLAHCVVKDGSGNLTVQATSGGWCVAQSDDLGDNESYTEYVSAGTRYTDPTTGQDLVQREIVSTGLVNGITRRVDVIVNAALASPLFPPNYAAVSLNSINWGQDAHAYGNVGTNGNITLSSTAQICGDAIAAGTITLNNAASVCGTKTEGAPSFNLSPVDPGPSPGASNARLAFLSPRRPPVDGEDTCTPTPSCSGVSWSPTTRVLGLSNDATLTLGGSSYSFCKITLRNRSKLIVAAGSTVKMYLDKPENCPAVSGAGSVILSNTSELVNGNSSSAAMQVYLIGSSSVPTTIDFGNSINSTMVLAIYAPYSSVLLENDGVHLKGALAAKSILIENSASITYDPLVGGITGGGIPVYRSTRSWIECTAQPTAAAVNSGCWNN